MSAPKPGSWIEPEEGPKKNPIRFQKPFILEPHLTNRPLKDSPDLKEFRNTIKKGNKK